MEGWTEREWGKDVSGRGSYSLGRAGGWVEADIPCSLRLIDL